MPVCDTHSPSLCLYVSNMKKVWHRGTQTYSRQDDAEKHTQQQSLATPIQLSWQMSASWLWSGTARFFPQFLSRHSAHTLGQHLWGKTTSAFQWRLFSSECSSADDDMDDDDVGDDPLRGLHFVSLTDFLSFDIAERPENKHELL